MSKKKATIFYTFVAPILILGLAAAFLDAKKIPFKKWS